MRPGFHLRAVLGHQKRHEPIERRLLTEFVVQQATAVVGDHQLDVLAPLEQRGQRARGVERAAGAGDGNGDRRRAFSAT